MPVTCATFFLTEVPQRRTPTRDVTSPQQTAPQQSGVQNSPKRTSTSSSFHHHHLNHSKLSSCLPQRQVNGLYAHTHNWNRFKFTKGTDLLSRLSGSTLVSSIRQISILWIIFTLVSFGKIHARLHQPAQHRQDTNPVCSCPGTAEAMVVLRSLPPAPLNTNRVCVTSHQSAATYSSLCVYTVPKLSLMIIVLYFTQLR
jgi:hypothetical protein